MGEYSVIDKECFEEGTVDLVSVHDDVLLQEGQVEQPGEVGEVGVEVVIQEEGGVFGLDQDVYFDHLSEREGLWF